LTIFRGGVATSKASTHEHSKDCFLSSHTHTGTPSTYGGCYKGAYITGICGGTINVGAQTQERGSSYCNNHGYCGEYIDYYAYCSKCGTKILIASYSPGCGGCGYGGGGTTYYDSTNNIHNVSVSYYELNCGIEEGALFSPEVPHTHIGKPTVQGGCYQGEEYTGTCGGSYSYSNSSSSYMGCCGGSISLSHYTCSSCGSTTTVNGSHFCSQNSIYSGSLPNSCSQIVKKYTQTCTGKSGIPEYPTRHVHTGTDSTYGGCYKGSGYSVTCTNTSSSSSSGWTHYSTDDDAYTNCPTCGERYGPGIYTVYKCNTCGQTQGTHNGYSNCSCGRKNGNYYVSGVSLGTHSTGYKYNLSCGKSDTNWYYSDGTKAVAICNKIVARILQRQ